MIEWKRWTFLKGNFSMKGLDYLDKKKVVLCGVPGMKNEDIVKMESYLREEYNNLDFLFLGENTLEKEELINNCKDVEILISWDQEVDEEVYGKLNLRAYLAASTGFNAANVEAATKYNVVVSNAKDYCKDEVATHAMMYILACARKLFLMLPYVKEGNWGLSTIGKIKSFKDSTVGILGLGSIGSNVAKKLSGFGVKIISCDPNVSSTDMEELGVIKVDFDTLLKESDYLSLHTPLLPSTKEVINLEALKKMKPTSYLINTSRGGVVKQDDLYFALTNGIIAGAGLDVLEHEPPKVSDKFLINLPNVMVTPHSAYLSEEASDAQLRITAQEAGRILRNEAPINLVNPQILVNLTWIKK